MIRIVIAAVGLSLVLPHAHAQTPPSIEPVQAKVSAFEPISIRWSNMPTSLNTATASLINADTNASVYNVSLDLSNPEKKRQGIFKFEGTLPGQYEVRVVAMGSYVVARTTVSIYDPSATSISPPAAAPQPSGPRPAPSTDGIIRLAPVAPSRTPQ